jgi:two-component sensor histidine kinase
VAVTPPPEAFRTAVPAQVDSLPVVRRWIRGTASHLPAERLDDLLSIVNELVANSVTDAGLSDVEDVHLVVRFPPEMVRVTVADLGQGFPEDWRWRRGMGLRLVELLADRLVVEPGSAVVTVEIDLHP